MSLWGSYLEELLDVSFNGVSFQSVTGGQVTDHDFDEMPEIRSSQNAISSAHRSITTGHYFITKQASVNIAVSGEFHELQAILARLRQLIQYKNRDLVLTRGVPVLVSGVYDLSDTTEITFRSANVVAADMNHNAARTTVITVQFTIDDPVGIGSDVQTLLNSSGVTAATTSINLASIDLQGTFQEQYPLFEITVNSITNGSNPTIEIENGLNLVTIAQALTAGDVLRVVTDPDTMRVSLNNELIDFSGSFPFIADPTSVIYIRDTFSARNLDIEVKTDPRYI